MGGGVYVCGLISTAFRHTACSDFRGPVQGVAASWLAAGRQLAGYSMKAHQTQDLDIGS